jgi:fibronectin type 3 domain-containing protein
MQTTHQPQSKANSVRKTRAMARACAAGLPKFTPCWNVESLEQRTLLASVPAPWAEMDIGDAVNVPGITDYTASPQKFHVSGSGSDIWNANDGFHFVYQTMSGDGVVTAQVSNLTAPDGWTKAGLMVRGGLDANAQEALIADTRDNGMAFQGHPFVASTNGQFNIQTNHDSTQPVWVRLVRAGNNVTGYYSTDGTTFTQLGATSNMPLSTDLYAGLAVTSHNNTATATADFTQVALAPIPAPTATNTLVVKPAADGFSANLTWAADPYADSYNVLRSTTKGGPYNLVSSSVATNSYTDYIGTDGTKYYYVIQSVNTTATGPNSNEAAITSGAPLVSTVNSTTNVQINWVAGINAASYSVARGTSRTGTFTDITPAGGLSSSTLTFTDTTATPGTLYYYVVTDHQSGAGNLDSVPVTGQVGLVGTGTGLRGSYYSATNNDYSKPLSFTRIDPTVNFDFGNNAPAGAPANFGVDHFSIRWTGQVQAQYTEPYTFTVRSDDGQRLYIDGQRVIDNWVNQGQTDQTYTTPAWNAGDKHTITYEYYESGGGAFAQLNWSSPSTPKQAVPVTQLFERAPDAAPTITKVTTNNGAARLDLAEVDNASGYNIYRSNVAGGPYTLLTTTPITTLSYTDTGLTNGQTYYYVATAVNTAGESAKSTEVAATPALVVTSAPTGVTARDTDFKQITVSWPAVPFADTYTVLRSSVSGGPYTTVVATGVTGTSVADNNLTPGTTYYYVVTTHNAAGDSAASSEVSATVGQGAAGHYYAKSLNNDVEPDVTGKPNVTRFDPTINFDSGAGNWLPGNFNNGSTDHYSVAWTGKILADTDGTYTFVTQSDDAGYLYVDGQLVSWEPGGHGMDMADDPVNSVQNHGGGVSPISLTAGYHDFAFLSANGTGGYGARINWQTPDNATRRVIPEDHLLATTSTPAAPTGLAFADNGFTVDLFFTDNATSEMGDKLQRLADGSNTWVNVATVSKINANTISDPNPINGQHVQYRIVPFNYEGDGTPSQPIDVTQSTVVTGVAGHYYNKGGVEPNITGTPDLVRLDPSVNYTDANNGAWYTSSRTTNFSVAWTGQVFAPVAGQYTFVTQSDDAGYLWIDDQRVSWDPGGHGPDRADSAAAAARGGGVAPITLTAGWHNLVMEYAQGGGGYAAIINWTTPTGVNTDGSAITNQVLDTTYLKPHESIPGAAATFTATPADASVTLNWGDDANHATLNWTLERATQADYSNAVVIATPVLGTNSFVDTGLTSGVKYYYRLTSSNYDGTGPSATTNTTTTVAVLANAPSNLSAMRVAGGEARIGWTDNSLNENNFLVQRRDVTTGGTFATVATLAANTTGYFDTGLVAGDTYEYQVMASNTVGNSAPTAAASITAVGNTVTSPWLQQDIGTVSGGGAGNIDGSGNFDLAATGADIWGTADAFHYVYQPMTGDGEITIHVTGQYSTDGWTKAGVMFRNDLTPGSAFMGVFDTGANGTHLQARLIPNDGTATTSLVDTGNGGNAAYLRIVRFGNAFTAYASDDGVAYRQVGATQNMGNMGSSIFVGLAITGHNNTAGNPGSFEANGVTVKAITAPDPSIISAIPTSSTDVRIAWSNPQWMEYGSLERATQSNFSDATYVTSIIAGQSYYVDHSLSPNTTYYYRFTASNHNGNTASTGTVKTLASNYALAYTGNYDSTGWTLQGNPNPNPPNTSGDYGAMVLTDAAGQRGWAFGSNPVDLTRFKASFDLYTPAGGTGDGMTLAFLKDISNLSAGGGGGALGYNGLGNSVALKFDLYNNIDKTDIAYDGTGVDGDGGLDLRPSNIDLNGSHLIHVDVTYDQNSQTLVETINDITSGGSWTHAYSGVDLASHLGGSTGYIGFTAATGGAFAKQEVVDFNYGTIAVSPLAVSGTGNDDTITVKSDGSNTLVWVNHDPSTSPADFTVPTASLSPFSIDAGGGNDTIILDFSGGNPVAGTGLSIIGGGGNDTLKVVGTAGDDAFITDGVSLSTNGSKVTYGGDLENLQIDGRGGNNSLTANAGVVNLTADLGPAGSKMSLVTLNNAQVNLTATQHLESLTASNTSKVAFDNTETRLLVTKALSINDTAVVDLNNNDMIMPYAATDAAGQLAHEAAIQTYVKNWYVLHSGPMLMASHANVAGFSKNARSLAVFDNHDYHSTNWGGEALSDFNQIIVKYTYLGDANGDGKVDPTDYAIVDGQQGKGHSWITGDLNFDGKVDPTDYAQIDGNQGAGYGTDGTNGGPRLIVNAPAGAALPAAPAPQLATLPTSTDTSTPDASTQDSSGTVAQPAASSPFSATRISANSDILDPSKNVLA